ncbi:MAG: sugar transferase [Candidatus Dormibacteraeota bacterium]|nr:sugar transferase [Candidatus Dormibacteraeota bacterium]
MGLTVEPLGTAAQAEREAYAVGRPVPWSLGRGRAHPSVSLRPWVTVIAAVDLATALLAISIGFWLRFGWHFQTDAVTVDGIPFWMLAVTIVPGWLAVLAAGGAYDRRFLAIGPEEYRRVLNCGVWLTGASVFLVFVLHVGLSRIFVAVSFPLLIALTLLHRYVIRQALHNLLATGHAIYRTVVIGPRADAMELSRHIDRVPWAGFNVVDICDDEETQTGTEELIQRVRALDADTIAVAGARVHGSGALRNLAWELEGTGIRLVVAPAVTDIAGPRIVVRPVEGLPLLMVEDPQMKGVRRLLKELLDRVWAITALVSLSPMLLAIAILIKLTSRGPVFYTQERVGLHGERFRMWKFRTMRVGADANLGNVAHLNVADGLLFKIRDDPRVTPIGRWLRRHSLDEIPQFWNVLRGDMALVGPRPPLPREVAQYGEDVRRRLLVKPGMTGLWQVSGRVELPWQEAIRLDLFYVENWSVVMDLMVLWKTMRAVVHGKGAY